MKFSFKNNRPETIVLSEGLETGSQKKSSRLGRLWQPFSFFLIVTALIFQIFWGSTAMAEKEGLVRRWYQLLEQKSSEQLNTQSFQSLLSQLDVLEREYADFSHALPADPRSDLVMSWIEALFEGLLEKGFVETPELISWRSVPDHDVKSSALEAVGITEYSFTFKGEYRVLIELFSELRSSKRLLDVRSFRNLNFLDEGLVSVDIVLWAYYFSH
jgi:hypothetical protein